MTEKRTRDGTRGWCLAMGQCWPTGHGVRRGVVQLLLGTAVAFAGARFASTGETRYLPFETFRAWHDLIPEAGTVRLCGLTRAGHAQGGLRISRSPGSVAVGTLMPDVELWAVLLEVGAEPAPCDGLLVMTRSGLTWERLAWQRLDLALGTAPVEVRWDGTRGAVLVDTGERRRLTAPATLRWEAGRVVQATPGFVIDARLIRHVLWWRADRQRLEYERLSIPLEIPDASEEQP